MSDELQDADELAALTMPMSLRVSVLTTFLAYMLLCVIALIVAEANIRGRYGGLDLHIMLVLLGAAAVLLNSSVGVIAAVVAARRHPSAAAFASGAASVLASVLALSVIYAPKSYFPRIDVIDGRPCTVRGRKRRAAAVQRGDWV